MVFILTEKIEGNRVETFDEVYGQTVQEMNQYLRDNGLNMISWTDDKGNTFKIRLSKKYFKEKSS